MKKLCLFVALALTFTACGCQKKENTEIDNSQTPTLKWYVPGSVQNDMEAVMEAANALIEPKIGAKLDIQMIDGGAFTEKMNLNMASGDEFDLTFTGYVNPYKQAVDNDGLYPLTELIDKNAPKLKEALPQYVFDMAKQKNEIYAIPNQQIMAVSIALCVKKDLAQKYNLDVSSINGVADIEPFLEKVKNGETAVYPFESGKGSLTLMLKKNSIENFKDGIFSGIYAYEQEDGSIKVMHEAETDLFKETAAKLNEWYQKGYIRKDVASINSVVEDRTAGKYAVFCTIYKPGLEAEIKSAYNYDVVAIPVSPAFLSNSSGMTTLTGIGRKSKNPVQAVKLIELMNTDKDVYNTICWGIEGKHYTKTGDNRIELMENSGYSQNAAWKFGNVFNSYLLNDQADDVWEQTKNMNENSEKSKLLGFQTDAAKKFRVEATQLESVMSEYHSRALAGAESMDNYYDNYIKALKNAGLDTVKEAVEKEINEYLK